MKNILNLAAIILVLSSCKPTYIPSAPHTPIFSNKGEFQARINLGFSGIDPQISYALTEHIGLMANTSFYKTKNDSTGFTKKRTNYEFGVGWYRNKNGRFVMELFGGYGFGKFENGIFKSGTGEYSSDAKLQKIFLQPAVGFVTDVMDISLAARFSHITILPELSSDLTGTALFFEPVCSVSFGFRYVKFNAQLGFSVPSTNETNLSFNYLPIIFNMGLTARIGRDYF